MSQNNTRPGYPLTNDAITGAPRTTINPVHQIIPKPNNLNPRSLATTTPTAYPTKQEVLPVTTAAAAYPAAPLSTAVVPATVQPVSPLQAAAKTAVPAIRGGRLLKRGDLHSGTEDAIMMDHVRATHDLDASHYNVKPLVHVIEDIIPRAKAAVPAHAQGDQSQPRLDAILEDKILHSGLNEALETFAYPVHRTSLEMICGSSCHGDAHGITLSLLRLLANYWWDAKVAIAFAAFAQQYGEFGLVARLYPTDPLAKSVATVKQIPEIMESLESRGAVNAKFRELAKLVDKMLEVTHHIVKFKDVGSEEKRLKLKYRLNMHKELADSASPVTAEQENLIAKASYFTVKAAVTCSLLLLNLIAVGRDYYSSTEEDLEISTLTHKLSYLLGDLQRALNQSSQEISKIKHQIKRKHSLDFLRRKYVFLLVSDLEIPNEVVSMLRHMYHDSKQDPSRPESQFEVVWLPIVDRRSAWTEAKDRQFQAMYGSMPWFSVSHPRNIDDAVFGYVKEVWGFTHKPLLAVVDPQGKLVNVNAFPMFWIFGSVAFPFTKSKEEALWNETSWNMGLLADSIDQNIFNWFNDGKCICLYGGEDMEWIRSFTKTARKVSQQSGIPLELLYVGKMNPKERIRRINATIHEEQLSHVLHDPTMVWFFWERLESMWYLRGEKTPTPEDSAPFLVPSEVDTRDPILQEVKAILSYDGSNRGWAVFSRGLEEMTKGEGKNIMQVLGNFENWKHEVTDMSAFIPALDRQLRGLHTKHHCTRMVVPAAVGHFPETVACVECGRAVEKFFMYSCCLDDYE
nr:protein SIEVE ELEMENT OCCLUSION B-like [Ipomoea batatas]